MSDKPGSRRTRGIIVDDVALDTRGWRMGNYVPWRYELWGRRLWRDGLIVAEGVASERDAVLWSMAWEACLADRARIQRMTARQLADLEQRSAIKRMEWEGGRENDE